MRKNPKGDARHHKGRGKGKKKSWNGLPSNSATPVIDVFASFTPDAESMLVPACGSRRLHADFRDRLPVDLALDRLLGPLQREDGAFALTETLVVRLGLSEPQEALKFEMHDSSHIIGTLLVIITLDVCKPTMTQRAAEISGFAEDFLNAAAPGMLELARARRYDVLPGSAAILSNFVNEGYTKYPIWAALASRAGRRWQSGSIVCPRFVVVDFGAALVSHYPVESAWQVFVERGVVFFSRGSGASVQGDWLRQGYVFEAAMVEPYLSAEDRLLAELHLPRCCFIYCAAPDAAIAEEIPGACGSDSEPEEQVLFCGSGGLLAEDDDSHDDSRNRMTAVVSEEDDTCSRMTVTVGEEHVQIDLHSSLLSRREYVEIKKTTHLNGRAGDLKRVRYWLQARLANIQRVVVGCTIADQLQVDKVHEYSCSELTPAKEGELWAGIDELGAAVLEAASKDGSYLVTLSNVSGCAKIEVQLSEPDPMLAMLSRQAMTQFGGRGANKMPRK